MLAALIVSRRSPASRRRALQLKAGNVAVKGEIEVQARLLAVGDDIELGVHLVMDGGDHRVVLHLGNVSRAETVEILRSEFQPRRKGVAADDGGAQRSLFHGRLRADNVFFKGAA